ncbi:MAG: type II secretion system F family protein [Acidobacteria bacterium]|nr:type II secretion system F family protein [Acidobacteriota bacterium]
MTLMIPILVFLFVTLTILSVYWLLFRPANATTQRLRDLGSPLNAPAAPVINAAPTVAERIATPLNRVLPASPDELRTLQRKLMYAGYRAPSAALLYRGIQTVCLIGFPLVTFGVCQLLQRPLSKSLGFVMLALLIGYLLPRIVLDKITAERQLHIQWGLADALDLLTVTVEAGMDFNAALVRVCEELHTAHPVLAAELELVNLEIRVGRSRAQALRNLGERNNVDDLRALCTMLIQSDRFGTSVGRAIRVYAHTLRTKRRQRAEQAAQKAAVKLLMPLALFLFPTLFIVVLGPAFLTLMDMFFKK